MTTMRDWAMHYLAKGYSVMPVGKDDGKKPWLISWLEFQKRLPTEKEINEWWTKWPTANIGIITGRISGLVVVDTENGCDFTKIPLLPKTKTAQSGGGGLHFYYKYPMTGEIGNSSDAVKKMDIRGNGGFIVAPPSLHKSGQRYSWTTNDNLYGTALAEAPEWLLTKEKKIYKGQDWSEITNGVSEHSRNDTATVIIGKLLAQHNRSEWESLVWPLAVAWNDKNTPPLPQRELRTTFDSIAKREINKPQKTQATVAKQLNDIATTVTEKDYKLRYTWGTSKLDNMFAIIKRSDFIVIGSKRNEGKSTYSFDMASKNAQLGHQVLYISLEMTGREIKEDFARKYAGWTIPEEREYRIPEDKQELFDKKLKEIDEIENLHFEGIRRGDKIIWETILEIIEKYQTLDIIFVDNLDLIEGKENEHEVDKQRRIVKSIMSFTALRQIPLALIHHYRKSFSQKEMGMDELSGSGKISDSADRVLKIVRCHDPNASYPERCKSTIHLQKARGYNEAVCDIYFIKGTFVDNPPEIKITEEEVEDTLKTF